MGGQAFAFDPAVHGILRDAQMTCDILYRRPWLGNWSPLLRDCWHALGPYQRQRTRAIFVKSRSESVRAALGGNKRAGMLSGYRLPRRDGISIDRPSDAPYELTLGIAASRIDKATAAVELERIAKAKRWVSVYRGRNHRSDGAGIRIADSKDVRSAPSDMLYDMSWRRALSIAASSNIALACERPGSDSCSFGCPIHVRPGLLLNVAGRARRRRRRSASKKTPSIGSRRAEIRMIGPRETRRLSRCGTSGGLR